MWVRVPPRAPEFDFRETTRRKAEDCVMVGDNYDVDVLAPKQLGIRGALIKKPLTSSRYPMEQELLKILPLEKLDKLP